MKKKNRLPTDLYADARNFESLLRSPATSLRERAALEMAMMDAMRERGVSMPFTLYPREAFLSLWKDGVNVNSTLVIGGHVAHARSFDHWRSAVIRLLHLIGFLSAGLSLKDYENQIPLDYKCDECHALLRRVARAGYRAERERAA